MPPKTGGGNDDDDDVNNNNIRPVLFSFSPELSPFIDVNSPNLASIPPISRLNSPSFERKRFEKVMELKEEEAAFKRENLYQTCTGQMTDRRILQFLSQILFGLIISCFCIYKLTVNTNCEDASPYMAVLSGIIGVFLPSPSITKK